jgi:hypothetical protein
MRAPRHDKSLARALRLRPQRAAGSLKKFSSLIGRSLMSHAEQRAAARWHL